MVAIYNPNDPYPYPHPPNPGGGGSTPATKIGSSPQLVTSTGGLLGTSGILLTPAVNSYTGNNILLFHDPTNFNCEDDTEYDFRQEDTWGQIPGEGRIGSINLVILKYRELGNVKFSINITVFNKDLDDFETIQIPVNIPILPLKTLKRKQSFPDKRIHTVKLSPPKSVITGERPQVSITSKGKSGAYSIISIVLCGDADEIPQM